MGTLTASNIRPASDGSLMRVDATVAFGSSYNNTGSNNTTGESIPAAALGLSRIRAFEVNQLEGTGFGFDVLYSSSGAEVQDPDAVRIKVFASAGGAGTTGPTSAGTPAGTNSAPIFTGTSPVSSLNLTTPAFSGTGLTAAGQVITTTDNQTMTLNQCAGMWLISATGATPPNLILSNTAVTGAPAVLTVQGTASTDAGAYKIVKSLTPIGVVSAPTFTGGALATHLHSIAAGGSGEVANGTDLSALTSVQIIAWGY